MDSGTKLEELQLTTDEIQRLSKALKDEKFRQMLHEYAEEISKPENKKKYEEEITKLEQERGMNVQFVHPKPHHVLKTSVNGKEKCFINICSNDLIGKPTCETGRGNDGRVGQHWSLPYSLAPGRSEGDAKGNKCTIYDVVFHPDTLYIAGKNARFMKLVNSTAIQGVEDAFKVKLDKLNAKALKIQYKGVPHPAIIRKPIPGHPGKDQASPDEKLLHIRSTDTAPNEKADAQDHQSPINESSPAPRHPTKPHYSVKYRSVVDLQDYRCSRDSAPGPRPKEIIVTIELPLIKSAGDIDLNVTERSLVLESPKPAYKLELQLSYPVDDDKGDAKFNKAKKQLTITLPVLPAKESAVVHPEGTQLVSEEEERDGRDSADRANGEVCEAKDVASVDKDEDNDTWLSDSCCNAQCLRDIPVQDHESGLQLTVDRAESKIDCLESLCEPSQSSKAVDALSMCEEANAEACISEKNSTDETEDCLLPGPDFCTSNMSSKHHSTEHTGSCSLGEEGKYDSKVEPTALSTVPPVAVLKNVRHCPQRAEIADVSQHKLTVAQPQMIHGVSNLEQESHDFPCDPYSSSQQLIQKSVVESSVVSVGPSQLNSTLDEGTVKTVSLPEETGMLAEEEVVNSSPEQLRPTPENKDIVFSSFTKKVEAQLKEQVDSVHSSEQSQTEFKMKTPALLREKNPEDGSEVIINDHATSAGLTFQNSLWFELD
ncbi:protein kintoun [Pygocentrus nattereri]|uniref:protein kintoun n=1 Tax=Pygocentrus nattereri TaxID=42514 RepID=UPI0008143611|nr:protein kintoun [Pygocentrus nattereri]